MGFIYLLISPSGKKYIGQTKRSFHRRWIEHAHSAKQLEKYDYKIGGCTALAKAINKYGFKAFKKIILIEVETHKFLDIYEKLYIKEYNTLSPNGYNLRSGGGVNHVLSQELKDKIKDKTQAALTKLGTKLKRTVISEGLPLYMSWFETKYKGKITGCGYRIRRHPKCPDKSFYVHLYGSKEEALKAALEFYESLTNASIKPNLKDQIKLEQSKDLPVYMSYYAIKDKKTGKITSELYRIRRHPKCSFKSFSTSDYDSLEKAKKAALKYYYALS